jgi:cyclopropane fatty-acyl-phospholipid synthase-like methyltransferase
MHGAIESWLNDTEADDQRSFDLLLSLLPNKKVLDFGCGHGDFLNKAKTLAEEVN